MEIRVDFHTHIIPEEIPDFVKKFGNGKWPTLEKTCSCGANIMVEGNVFREVTNQVWSPEKRIEDMDREGVDIQVLSPIPVTFSYWAEAEQAEDMSKIQNDFIAQTVEKHPNRFIGLGTVPLQDMDVSIREMKRCKYELGLKGIEIGTNINGKNLDDPDFTEFFKKAEEWEVPLFVHPWETLGRERMPRHNFMYTVGMPSETALAAASLVNGGVMEKFPELKVCFAHSGGSFPYILPRLDQGWEVWPELRKISKPPSHYAKNFYFDSLNYNPQNLKYLIEKFGYKNVVMGSDYPFLLREIQPGKVIDDTPELSSDERKAILGLNALEFLNIDREEFLDANKKS